MLKIPQQQSIDRYESLPENLQKALFSPINARAVYHIGEIHHLSDEKISVIATLAGDVILGFIHPDDLAREIKVDLDIDLEIANSISREINRKIFGTIRGEMDKIYSPPAPVVSDIVEAPVEVMSNEKGEVREEEAEPALIGEIIPASSISTEPTEEKKISLEEFQVMGPAGQVAEPSAPQEPPTTEQGALPTVPPAASPVEPFILHQESELKPISETPKSFSLSRFFDFLKKKETKSAEAPSVVLEMGDEKLETKETKEMIEPPEKIQAPETPQVFQTEIQTETEKEAPKIKVVDYTIEPPATPTNLPTEQLPQEETPTTFGVGAPTPDVSGRDVGEEKKDDVIDLSSFERQE